MTRELRALYDRLYIGVETYLLAREARREGRKYAKSVHKNPLVDQEYKTTIRSYWKQFRGTTPDKFWFTLFANQNRPFSPKYIPDDLWFRRIIPHYNNLLFAKALQDKCLHNVLFPDIRRPATIVKNIAGVFYDDALDLITHEDAVARCQNRGRILVKPSIGSGQGHGICFYDSDSLSGQDIENVFQQYGQNFIVQEKMSQHETLARLNPRSINTIRVISFLHNGQVHILTAILRVGGGSNEVDNSSQGGYKCTIMPDGHLHRMGTTKRNGRWEYSEILPSGIRFEDIVIPSYDLILETVRQHAAKMSHFKIIGWDMAVTPDGIPVLIEYNVIPAQGHGTDGPVFGDLTDEVLAEVLGRRLRKGEQHDQ